MNNYYKCVNQAINVTVGRIYQGEPVSLDGVPYVRVKNDKGYYDTYRPERFEKID